MTSQNIGSALDRVVKSKTFSRSRSLQDFLTFIVTQSLEPDQNLKEYRIGVDALNRGGAFNPAESSIVRVQAYRLRAKLADYYQHEGQSEDVRIDLEPGSYKPVIREHTVLATLRSLRLPGLVVDLLPLDHLAHESRECDPATVLYRVISTEIDALLRSAFRHRDVASTSRLHLQVDFRARVSSDNLRAITYLTDADSTIVLCSEAISQRSGASVSELQKAGVKIAQAISMRIECLLSCNG